MDQINFKATATVQTDQGVFEAVISTEAVDRENDIVHPDAMVAAIKAWKRPIPLAWQHSTKPEDIFGSIEPMTARTEGGEVIVQGQVDLESKVGQEAWRSFKSRTIGFSFGYLVPEGGETKATDGTRHITALDVFEITATRAPMNNDTRVLATKGAIEEAVEEIVEDGDLAAQVKTLTERLDKLEQASAIEGGEPAADDPLKTKTDELLLSIAADGVPSTPPEEPPPSPQPAMELDELRRKTRDLFLENLSGMELQQ